MDRAFWTSIKENDFRVPAGHTPASLAQELTALLGSTDPELRDLLGYEILGTWIERGLYTAPQLEALAAQLMANLEAGIGENGTDSVFGRSYAALILAEIVAYDSSCTALRAETLEAILSAAERYLAAEQDLRDFIPGKYWAHSPAHTADLLRVCAEHPRLGGTHLRRILAALAAKVTKPVDDAYAAGEGERLARAALAAVRRGMIPPAEFEAWAMGVAERTPKMDFASKNAPHFNSRGFLTSLYALLCCYGLAEADSVRRALSAMAPRVFRALEQ